MASPVDRWRDWIDGQIPKEVRMLYLRRDVFQRVGEMVSGSDLPPSYYWAYLGDTYATTQAMGIRRQADTGGDVISLGRLLTEIRSKPSYVTREGFLKLYPADDQAYAARQFEAFADATGVRLDPKIPAADLSALKNAAAAVTKFADKHLAHSDPLQSPADIPTFAEIAGTIDEIGALVRKYGELLKAVDYQLLPLLGPEWVAIFHKPWLKPEPPIWP